MANGSIHRVGAGVIAMVASAYHEAGDGKPTMTPYLAGGLAAACGTLPDVLEPALHPNHRQFFHSLAVVGMIGTAWYRAYKWTPETVEGSVMRWMLLVVGGAYLTHLAMDAMTPKGLPLLGRL